MYPVAQSCTKGEKMKKDKVIYDYALLRRNIIFKYGTLKKFARDVLNITPTYLSRVLSSNAEYSQKFIESTITALEIKAEDIGLYFFTKELHKSA